MIGWVVTGVSVLVGLLLIAYLQGAIDRGKEKGL